MSDTANLSLPLVQSSQAQKHVTVNEALARLDAMTQLGLVSRDVATPPSDVADGTAYIVPPGAGGAWSGETNRVAVYSNGGWVFVPPRAGWRGWLLDRGEVTVFDGAVWSDGAVALSAAGAATRLDVIELDVAISGGSVTTTQDVIPQNAIVFGVTGIVTSEITGTLGSWALGVPGAPDRYGSGIGLALGSWVKGVTGQPQAYYAAGPLTLSAAGGTFTSGAVRLAVHAMQLALPRV